MKTKPQNIFTYFADNIIQYFSGETSAYLDEYKTPDGIDTEYYIGKKLRPILIDEVASEEEKIGSFSRIFDRISYDKNIAKKEYDQVFSMATYQDQINYMKTKMAHAEIFFINRESTPPRLRKHFIDAINCAYPPTEPTTYEKLVKSMCHGDETKFAQIFVSNAMIAYYDAMLSNENNKRLQAGMIIEDELIKRSRVTLTTFDIIAHSFFNEDNNIDKFILPQSEKNELMQLVAYIEDLYEKLLLMDEGLDLELRRQLIDLNIIRYEIANYIANGDMSFNEVNKCREFIQSCRELLQNPLFNDTVSMAFTNFASLSVFSEEKKARLKDALMQLQELDVLLSELLLPQNDPDLILVKTLKKSAKDLLNISDQKLTAYNNVKIQDLFSAMKRFDEESFTQRLSDAKKIKMTNSLLATNEIHNELNDKRVILEQYKRKLTLYSKRMEAIDVALRELAILSTELNDVLENQRYEKIEELVSNIKEYFKIVDPIISPTPTPSPATSRSSSFSSIMSSLSRRSPSPKNDELLQQTNNDMILLYDYRKYFTHGEQEYISAAINELKTKQNAISSGSEVQGADTYVLTHLILCARAYELLQTNKDLSKGRELTDKYELVYNTLKKDFMSPFSLENSELEKIIEIIEMANKSDVYNIERQITRASDFLFKKVTDKFEATLKKFEKTNDQIQELSFLCRIHNPILNSEEIDKLLQLLGSIHNLVLDTEREERSKTSELDSYIARIEEICHYNHFNDPMSRYYDPNLETLRNSF